MTHYIYGLTDEKGIVHYVGCTKDIRRRLIEHHDINQASPKLRKWLKQIPGGVRVIILDIAGENEDHERLERFHIHSHLMAGFPLFNFKIGARIVRNKDTRQDTLDLE